MQVLRKKIEADLSNAKENAYIEKVKQRQVVKQHVDEMELVATIVQNYADMQNDAENLEEDNDYLRRELKAAISEKRAAIRLCSKAKHLAAEQLTKWHEERALRCEAQDMIAHQTKACKDMEKLMEEYKSHFNDSENKMHRLKKEWANDDAEKQHGGGRRWPVWVIQVICELLVYGIPPSAVPAIIQTLYQTLYRERPNEIPSVNFVRQCRVIVEVICETIAAIKLADALLCGANYGQMGQHNAKFHLQHWWLNCLVMMILLIP